MGFYKYLRESEPDRSRLIEWRKSGAVVRLEHPTRLDRARALGYRAKQGFILVRVRLKRGGRTRPRPQKGRRPARAGSTHFSLAQGHQAIAEKRAAKRFPNLEVLNSYYLDEDGVSKYFEVILVDPNHPAIKSDKRINWICGKAHTRRVYRAKTSAARKSRGLRHKGKGAERLRPSNRK